MSSSVRFRAEAKIDFLEAIKWYESQVPGLGRDFAQEVIQTIKRAYVQPELFPQVRGRARKIRLRRFRLYTIYFAVKANDFAVLAVFHAARNPDELTRRLS
jgi:plasmid stabilization system protein ParE